MAIHKDFRANEDATVVRRLREAGAVLIVKLRTTEGAYSDHHPSVVAPENPWDAACWPVIGEKPELVARLQRFTCAFDMTGSPTIALPGGCD